MNSLARSSRCWATKAGGRSSGKRREPEWQRADVNDVARTAASFAAERARSRKVELETTFAFRNVGDAVLRIVKVKGG